MKPLKFATGPVLVGMIDWSEVSWLVYATPDGRVRARRRPLGPKSMRPGEYRLASYGGVPMVTAIARGKALLKAAAIAA